MKPSAYWKQRFEALNRSLLDTSDQYCYEEVEKQFRIATREIEKEISIWYKRLAANNDISMADAKALLAGKDLQEFRWTVQDYIKHGQEYGISGKWAKELENASARAHITQLDALKLQMQQQLEVLYGNQVDGLDQRLRDIYSDGFYKTAYEVDKGIGVGSQLRQLDNDRLKNVISKPWCSDGKTFSDRLWRDKDTLNSTLQRELSQAVIRGDGLDVAVKNLADRMNSATSAAARLVMTESAFFASAGQAECFDTLGVKQYEFVATLDDRTSPECQDMDGKVFDMKDMQPGVNAPPLHCWCRSCIAPYFGDAKGTRAARGVNGKTEQVPADMTYPEWKKSFVAKTYDVPDVKADIYPLMEKKEITPAMQNLFGKYLNTEYIKVDPNLSRVPLTYDPEQEKVVINPEHPNISQYNIAQAMTHELMHLIDNYQGIAVDMAASISDAMKQAADYVMQNKQKYDTLFSGEAAYNMFLSDAFAALTKNKVMGFAGHGLEYWEKISAREKEFIANIMTLYLSNDTEALMIIKEIPGLKELLEELIDAYGKI